jgi:hypothetical protein
MDLSSPIGLEKKKINVGLTPNTKFILSSCPSLDH